MPSRDSNLLSEVSFLFFLRIFKGRLAKIKSLHGNKPAPFDSACNFACKPNVLFMLWINISTKA